MGTSTTIPTTSNNSGHRNPATVALDWMGPGILALVGVWGWMYFVVLQPLHEEALEMHARQLDPTEIIDIPLPTSRLLLLVVFPMALVLFGYIGLVVRLDDSRNGYYYHYYQDMIQSLRRLVYVTLTLSVAMILCGASPTHNLGQTVLAALYLASLLAWDPCASSADWHPFLLVDDPQRSPPTDKLTKLRTRSSWIRMHTTLGMTILFQILLLYDRGWQVQRWPLPTLLGSTLGWTLGALLNMMMIMARINKIPFGTGRTPESTTSPK